MLFARRYRLRTPLGRGGSATAWRALDLARDTEVALKLLSLEGHAAVEAFRVEFARLAGMAHPSLVEVLDHGAAPDTAGVTRHYTAAALIDGTSLAETSATSWDSVTEPLGDALEALAFLHASGTRHGDFKPANVVARADGRGVLIDLGAAAPLGQPAGSRVSGTPRYLAPEILTSSALDARADLFAVGVTISSIAERLSLALPASVRDIARALVAPSREARPASVHEVLVAMGRPATRGRATTESPRFLGRFDEMAKAAAALDTVLSNAPGPRIVAIEGAEGIGKSRFLRELKWMAQQRAPAVVEGFVRPRGSVRSLLARAAELDDLDEGIEGVLAAHARLVERGSPVVLVMDDADILPDAERESWSSFLRLLRSSDPVLVLGVALGSMAPEKSVHIELGPLTDDEVTHWFPGLPTAALREVVRWSGGVPSALVEAGRVATGESALATGEAPLSQRRTAAVESLDEDARLALALLAVCDTPLDVAGLAALGSGEDALWAAHRAGLVRRDGARWRLSRGRDASALERVLGAKTIEEAQRRVLRWLEDPTSTLPFGSGSAKRAQLLVSMGALDEAARALEQSRDVWRTAPGEWSRVASSVADGVARTDATTLLLAAEVLEVAGDPTRASSVLERAELTSSDSAMSVAFSVAKASCAMKLGRPDAVLAALAAIDSAALASSPALHARACDLRSRASIKLGDYEGALAVARAALDWLPETSTTRGDLLEDVGVACSYLGRHEDANRALAQAATAQALVADPRREVRTSTCWAIDDYRAGRIDSAIERYRASLVLAERHRLTDLVASASLNLGSALHQRGFWGEAQKAYARGGRLASALGQTDVAMVSAFDLAKLHVDVGSFAQAQEELGRAREFATAAGSRFFVAACDDLEGELRISRDGAGGAPLFRAAEQAFVALGAIRETAEVRAHLAELTAKTDVREARRWLDAAVAAAEQARAADLDVRMAVARAKIELAAGDAGAARNALEPIRSNDVGSVVRAEIDGLLADAWARDGAEMLASEHRQKARMAWERTAASLAPSVRAAFWAHPARRGIEHAGAVPGPSGSPSRREAKLERLLAVHRLLVSTLDTDEVLRRTMDAAIEMTGAERGFVILSRGDPPRLEVVVARNVDRERVGRSHLKFSHSIAERVIETAEPIIAADAAADDRFSDEESVHAMRLRSVAAVPIRGPEEVLGALYLDNRFQPSRFEVADVDLLTAFADQVAIALRNAELHEALVRRTEELEREKLRVEAAFRGQLEQIEALTEDLRSSREALAQRYEYGEIVAGSAAMRRVLGTLDRVIESDLSVLVQGESGTGKELIARAIHVHSPRSNGPFIGINCAALPETLLESELFGHVRGAFTGADKDRPGLMVSARGGTLFLDEIGEMPLAMQAKLLRALQEREVRPIGSAAPVAVDFRLVCATNRVLRAEAEQGRFRQDLYYRVGVVEITLPPLRERSEDIPAIASRVLGRLERDLGRACPRLSPRAMQLLVRHAWPGNVRELENVLAKAVITTEGDEILPADLDVRLRDARHQPGRKRATEKDELLDALRRTDGHAGKAARMLGVSRATFYRRLAQAGITPSERGLVD